MVQPMLSRPRTCQDARHVTSSAADKSSPRYPGWRVVLACYLAALCCWGFGLYGHGVYLTELNRLHGWPTGAISAGITGFYLLTAALVVFVGDASRGSGRGG